MPQEPLPLRPPTVHERLRDVLDMCDVLDQLSAEDELVGLPSMRVSASVRRAAVEAIRRAATDGVR